MILRRHDFRDDEALKEIIAYRGARKQVWDNTNLAGPLRIQAVHRSCVGRRIR